MKFWIKVSLFLFINISLVGGLFSQDLAWKELYKGKLGIDSYGKRTWIPDLDAYVIWPLHEQPHGRGGSDFILYSHKTNKVENKKGLSAPDYMIQSGGSGLSPISNVYLPGLKKMLFLNLKHGYKSKGKEAITSWFLDPLTGKWEISAKGVSMSEKSTDHVALDFGKGALIPVWGNMVYDAYNKEAFAFGGGATWGRTSIKEIDVKVGDWFLDKKISQFRRLIKGEPVQKAKRWFPAHCGTWLFSEASKKWSALKQNIENQPSGRILPGMAFVAGANKIILFGGDDLSQCFDDTWEYDCVAKTWSKLAISGAVPPGRAGHAMVYLPEMKKILVAGGYGGGWKKLKDMWLFDVEKKTWEKSSLDLPVASQCCSGDYNVAEKSVLLTLFPGARGNKRRDMKVISLKLVGKKFKKAKVPNFDKKENVHSVGWKRQSFPVAGEWPGSKTEDDTYLKSLPVNTWQKQKFKQSSPYKGWGSSTYDIKSHQVFTWGGGHSTYPGAGFCSYSLLSQRWDGMVDNENYNPIWLHGMVGGPSGVSFGGWSLLQSHARRSYGVDPISNTVVTYLGDVYDVKAHQFIKKVAKYPAKWGGFSTQIIFATAKHGLYSYGCLPFNKGGRLYRVNVKDAKWELVAKGGPLGHHENNHMCYDSKRDRLVYIRGKEVDVWIFDFKTKTWSQEKPVGGLPKHAWGDSTYIPELDSVLVIWGGTLYFYHLEKHQWFSSPYVGDKTWRKNVARDFSPVYDPKYKVIVRIMPANHKWMDIFLMRVDPKTLKLSEIK